MNPTGTANEPEHSADRAQPESVNGLFNYAAIWEYQVTKDMVTINFPVLAGKNLVGKIDCRGDFNRPGRMNSPLRTFKYWELIYDGILSKRPLLQKRVDWFDAALLIMNTMDLKFIPDLNL